MNLEIWALVLFFCHRKYRELLYYGSKITIPFIINNTIHYKWSRTNLRVIAILSSSNSNKNANNVILFKNKEVVFMMSCNPINPVASKLVQANLTFLLPCISCSSYINVIMMANMMFQRKSWLILSVFRIHEDLSKCVVDNLTLSLFNLWHKIAIISPKISQ